jgi:hypothetical protein
MNTSRCPGWFLIFGLACAAVLTAGPGVLAASNSCTVVGTWYGAGDSGITWIGTMTPGGSATVGQLTMEWVLMDATLGGFFPSAVRVTDGMGVWQKGKKQSYAYTWVAYAFDANGALVYSARASGTRTSVNCDLWSVTYVLELWLPNQDMETDPPYFCAPGTATETRMTLVQSHCVQ